MKTVYIDMDDTLCDFCTAYKTHKLANPEIAYPQSQVDFFRNLEPIDGAISAVNQLENSGNYTVYILTAPSIKNPMCYMEKRIWVENHLGMDFVERLIISPDKSLFIGDILIDDYISGKGQEGFQGELIQFGTEPFIFWDDVLRYLQA